MKIAFLSKFQGSLDRGAETFVRELSKRLSKNHEIRIFSGPGKPKGRWPILWRFYIDPSGIDILLFTIKKIPEIVKGGYDIVIPINGGWQSAIIRLTTWIFGCKVIISGQSGRGWDDRNNLWSFPDCFISLSTTLKKWAKEINPFVKVDYIPNGVDLNKFYPNGEKISIKLPKPIILCVGALTNEKRIELLIYAVSSLSVGSLLVAGEGPLRNKLSVLGKRLLGKRFLLTYDKFENMPKYYRSADIFSLPSPSYRSFEIVIIEALATNLPVVVNNDPIRAEIVGDG